MYCQNPIVAKKFHFLCPFSKATEKTSINRFLLSCFALDQLYIELKRWLILPLHFAPSWANSSHISNVFNFFPDLHNLDLFGMTNIQHNLLILTTFANFANYWPPTYLCLHWLTFGLPPTYHYTCQRWHVINFSPTLIFITINNIWTQYVKILAYLELQGKLKTFVLQT